MPVSYFILAVPMHECLGKTLVHEFHIFYCDAKWFFLFLTVQLQLHSENPVTYGRNMNLLVNLITKTNQKLSIVSLTFLKSMNAQNTFFPFINLNGLMALAHGKLLLFGTIKMCSIDLYSH